MPEHAGFVDGFIVDALGGDGGTGHFPALLARVLAARCGKSPVREVFFEAGRAFQQGSCWGDDEAGAVENEIVLAANLVEVDNGGVDLAGALNGEVLAGLAFALFEWRAVDGEQNVDILGGELGYWAAILPNILTDCHADALAVHFENKGLVAGAENTELVEDAVVVLVSHACNVAKNGAADIREVGVDPAHCFSHDLLPSSAVTQRTGRRAALLGHGPFDRIIGALRRAKTVP